MVATASATSLKVWSASSKKCIRSIDDLGTTTVALPPPPTSAASGAAAAAKEARGGAKKNKFEATTTTTTATCLQWLPGDRYVVVGTKEGSLLVCDLASGAVGFREDGAHGGSGEAAKQVNTLDLSADGLVLASGGGDCLVKLWDIDENAELSSSNSSGGGELGDDDDDSEEGESDDDEGSGGGGGAVRRGCALVHTKTLKMGDDVLCVRFTPNSRDPSKVGNNNDGDDGRSFVAPCYSSHL
jgi:WD40 repeat protein